MTTYNDDRLIEVLWNIANQLETMNTKLDTLIKAYALERIQHAQGQHTPARATPVALDQHNRSAKND